MEVLNRVENSERGFKQANLRRGKFQLEVLEIDNVTMPDQRVGGYFKFGFTVEKFNQWVEDLRDKDVDFHGSIVKDPATGKSMVIIKDPDGNRIQIFEK